MPPGFEEGDEVRVRPPEREAILTQEELIDSLRKELVRYSDKWVWELMRAWRLSDALEEIANGCANPEGRAVDALLEDRA